MGNEVLTFLYHFSSILSIPFVFNASRKKELMGSMFTPYKELM